MSDLSAGQWVGGIVGGVIGAIYGGPVGAAQGFALGAGIGGYIDPPPGPNLKGPTLDDKSFQSSAYGTSISNLYGTIATMGSVIYLENNEYKAVSKKKKTGGKGGSSGSYTTTTYFATFAVAIGNAVPGYVPRRIWAGGKLIYSAGTDDFRTSMESYGKASGWHFYDGTQTEPDARIESVIGVDVTPSYEGTAYIIFYDFDLTDYGNGLAGCPIKIEIGRPATVTSSTPDHRAVVFTSDGVFPSARKTIRPMSTYGYFSAASYKTELTEAVVLSVNIENDKTRLNVPIGDNTKFIKYAMSGVSSGAYFALAQTYYTGVHPDLKLNYFCITDKGSINNPFVHDGGLLADTLDADFVTYHETELGSIFIECQATSGAIDIGNQEYFLWRAGATIADRLNIKDGSLLKAVAVGDGFDSMEGYVALISGADSFGMRLVEIYNHSFEFRFNFQVELSSYGRTSAPAKISEGKIYLLADWSLASGTYKLAIIDIEQQECELKIINVTPEDIGGEQEYPSISVIGGMLAIGTNAPAGKVNFYFTNISGVIGREPILLRDVCSDIIHRSGLSAGEFDVSSLDDYIDGYRVDGLSSARGSLSPLQGAYLFDFIEDGYVIRAVKRGGVADGSINIENVIPNESGILVKSDFISSSQLPSRYVVNYIDYNREYEPNSEHADYPSSFDNVRSEQVPIVMGATAAAKLADVFINLSRLKRRPFSFSLPQIYLGCKPAGVYTTEVSPGRFENLFFESVEYTYDQRVNVTATLTSESVFQSSAVGTPVAPPPETMDLIGPSRSVLLDIPMVLDAMDVPGFIASPYQIGSKKGAILFRSTDSGQSYDALQDLLAISTAGTAENVLPANSGLVIDRTNSLRISIAAGEFDSITEAQMMTGKNYIAYGAPGRWEIMQYSSAVIDVDSSATLSIMPRGMFGTEWATGLHQVGDYVILLDDGDNIFIGADLSSVDIDQLYKTVTVGQDVQSVEEFTFNYGAVNLKPLSPSHAVGVRTGNDWSVSCILRTRYSDNFWRTGNQPQNESVIELDWVIYNGASPVRIIRTSAPSMTYTQAQQIEDFGVAQSTLHLKIYQRSQRVGAGYPCEVTV